MEFRHESVLPDEVIGNLNIEDDGIYVDGTVGGGGHSFRIAERLGRNGRIIGIDQDEEALAAAAKRLKIYEDKVLLIHDNYAHTPQILKELDIPLADGILLDLGVSSYQLDNPERGFSYLTEDAPLDMRMDQTQSLTAADILNTYSESELVRILRDYGEEKCAVPIARNIIRERSVKPLETTGELAAIVRESIPMRMQERGKNPCRRTFQAVRIACNRELEVLEDSIDDLIDLLKPGGRLCIITFHSLEDRIVKNTFRRAENPCICPPEFPVCVCGRKSRGKVVTRKAIQPGPEELRQNKRAASAKLRVFERTMSDEQPHIQQQN
ncbi:MAG: 16S rRNA (cytosine(1402)-N(4))-methyltransferase RsmH [Lachnospiraceae bacterium]|nr:16S rRNA (cytosine(1402)-N(4))-methyltransferase RsmH [Lachnospiraceae bacterium]